MIDLTTVLAIIGFLFASAGCYYAIQMGRPRLTWGLLSMAFITNMAFWIVRYG